MMSQEAFRTLGERTVAEDWSGARDMLAQLQEAHPNDPAMLENLRSRQGTLLSLEGKHAEAAALYGSIDRSLIEPRNVPIFLNNFAWALALSGDPGRAVPLARESIEVADAITPPLSAAVRPSQMGTLGAALALSGKAEEAIPLLEDALASGGSPRDQSARSFFYGEALRGAGRTDDAIAAYRRAEKESPTSSFAKTAVERLRALNAYRL
jgi:tetratricopeptide (TPR) repeat protein